jgi:hypothetical protein
MNTIDPAVLSKSHQQILHVDPAELSDFQRQIFQLERDNTSELIHFEKGTTPILLSAPHTVNFLKEDGNFKMREGYTKAIVKYLALKTGAFLMIKENSDGIDPNKPEMENYKRRLLEIIEQYQIQLVLDIHGAASHHDFAIEIGSLDGVSAKPETIKALKTVLLNQGIAPVAENNPFKGGGITKTVHSNTKAEVLQLEINRNYRDLTHPEKLFYICKSLENFLKSFPQLNSI